MERLKNHLGFLAIVLLTIVIAYPYQQGISPFDPGDYARCAVQFLRGEWDFQNFYCNRIGTYLPIALAIKLFGYDGYYLTWVTVFELVMLMAVIYFSLRRYSHEISLIACMLTGFSPVMLELSGTLFGDIMAALTSNLCILWIWHIRYVSSKPKQTIAGVLLAFMWFFAVATKESAVYFLLPMLIYFIYDLRNRQFKRFWYAAIVTGVAVGSVFLLVYVLKTGDILYRLRIVEEGPNVGRDTYLLSSWRIIFTRITVLPVKFMFEQYSFFVLFLPALLFLFNKSLNEKERFFKVYLISLLTMWWLGSQSFRAWTPVLLIDRLWLPVLVPLAISAAHVYYWVGKRSVTGLATWRSKVILALAAILIVITGFMYEYELSPYKITLPEFMALRMMLLIFLFVAIFHRETAKNAIKRLWEFSLSYKHYFLVMLVFFISVVYFNTNVVILRDSPKDNNYRSEKEMIDFVQKSGQHSIIVCDKALHNNYGIYFGFAPDADQQIHFLDWSAADSLQIIELAKKQPVYLLVTKDRLQWFVKNNSLTGDLYPQNFGRSSIPSFVLNPDLNWEVVKSNSRSTLYRRRLAQSMPEENM